MEGPAGSEPIPFLIVGDRHGSRRAARHRLPDLRFSHRPVDLLLENARQCAHIGVDLVEQQVDPGSRGCRIGADIVLVGLLQAAADFRRRVAGKSLHVPERKTAGDEQIKEHRASDDQHELSAEGAQAQTGGVFPGQAHSGLRPEAAQMGQPA